VSLLHKTLLCVLFVSTFALGGCVAQVGDESDEEEIGQADDALGAADIDPGRVADSDEGGPDPTPYLVFGDDSGGPDPTPYVPEDEEEDDDDLGGGEQLLGPDPTPWRHPAEEPAPQPWLHSSYSHND
jgi:hypothetical protein